jgi:glycosyltransferase involved in cell wall biosynthesis
MVGEHFGISAVEAMAAGCVPVVNGSGGTRETIGTLGYVYGSTEECVNCIHKALASGAEPTQIAENAKRFNSANFREAFVKTLKSKGFL